MFSEVVTSTPFTTEDAEYIFKDKIPLVYLLGNDVSLTSTLRALIAPRMPAGRTLQVYSLEYSNGGHPELNDIIPSDMVYSEDAFCLASVSIPGFSADENEAALREIRSQFAAKYEDYEELEMVEGYFQNSFPMLCFVNRELRSTMLVLLRLNTRKLHLLQVALLAMMPWYYDPSDKTSATPEEIELLRSLNRSDGMGVYLGSLNKFIKKYGLREARIRRLMDGFETRVDRQRMERVRAEMEDQTNEINSYNEAIIRCIRRKNESQITLMGLLEKIAEAETHDSELMGYLIRNARISVDSTDGPRLTVIAKDYFEYYDEDMVERCLNNVYSDVYYRAPSPAAANDMVRLLRAVFIDKKAKIRTSAAYTLELGGGVSGQGRFDDGVMYDDSIPNPHIYYYECLGDYSRTLNQMMFENDYIGAVDQCLASVRSLNWGDSAVMNRFFADMYEDSFRCVELPDGKVVFPTEAIEWLSSEEKRAKEEEERRAICFTEDDDEEIEEEEE